MARLLGWLLIAAAVALAGWWYFSPDTLPAALRRVAPATLGAPPAAAPDPRGKGPALYKWRDADGRLNVTDVPPKDRAYETVRYDPDTNVVPGYRRPDAADDRPIPPPPAD